MIIPRARVHDPDGVVFEEYLSSGLRLRDRREVSHAEGNPAVLPAPASVRGLDDRRNSFVVARTRYSELSSSGYSARECLGIFYIDRFSASSHVQTDFHYSHLRDRPSVAAEGHQPSRSEIMRSLAVSPALDGAGTAARLHDLDRLYGLVVRGEEEGDRVHDEQWLPAAPWRSYADQLAALIGAGS